MKNLSHMLRRALGPQKKKRRQSRALRSLRSQTLEKRELLAGDLQLTNGWNVLDVNDDYQVTPRDALAVINEINRRNTGAQGESASQMFYDTNDDDRITASDALFVINNLGEPEGMTPLVEYMLTARDLDDNALPIENGAVNVEVGQEFFLEVSYNDLRVLGADTGVFLLITDLTVSSAGNLEPVLYEVQRFIFSETLASSTSGNLTFTEEGTNRTYISNITDFLNGPSAEFDNALAQFGYNTNQYTLENSGGNGSPFVFDVRFTEDAAFGNVDLPNITISANLDNTVDITNQPFDPVDDSGNINSDAVRFHIDSRSRTFNGNREFYSGLNSGAFDNATGTLTIGGAGQVPTNGGGIPELSDDNDLIEPFDAFSFRVRMTSAASNFQVNVGPDTDAEGGEFLLLYNRDDAVPADLITLDDDARVIINATNPGGNLNPEAGDPLTLSANVNDAAPSSINVLDTASDPNGDTVTLQSITLNSGDDSGVTINGSTVTVDPSQYTLNANQSINIVYDYVVTDGTLTDTNTLTITVNGADGPPTIDPISVSFQESAAASSVDLLAGATDPDGDTISVVAGSVSLTSGDDRGVAIDEANNELDVTPQAYVNVLDQGQSSVVIYSYRITDGNTEVANTVTVTINGEGVNQPPVVGDPITANFSEDDADATVDLLQGASDPESQPLNVTNATLSSGNAAGVTVDGNNLDITPSAYNFLQQDQVRTVVFTYDVTDGVNNVAQTATIRVTGVNDQPVVSAPIAQTFSTQDSTTTVDLLANASDPDRNTVLNVDGTSVSLTGDTSGVSYDNANGLTVDPSQYSINDGSSVTVTANYTITDGAGGTVSTTATITITGNAAPVLGTSPLNFTFSENDGAQQIDLLQDATDPDGDTLRINNFQTVSGDDSGVSRAGTLLNVTPNTYSSLNDGENENLTFTYNVIDGNGGSVQQTVNITITGSTDPSDNVAPVVSQAITSTISEDDAETTINLLQFASDANNDTLNVVGTSVAINNDPNGAATINGNQLVINPNAYNNLNAGESQVITVTYDIADPFGLSVAQTATITITGANDGPNPPTVITGNLFIDENNPTRNGEMDADESGLAGIVVRLTSPASDNSGGVDVDRMVLTELDGSYTFANVQPGTYQIEYEIPPNVIHVGDTTMEFVALATGGNENVNFAALGLSGGLSNLDILSSSYLNENGAIDAMSEGGVQGGSVALGSDGAQDMFVANEGFDGVRFAELALNQTRDAALLTVLMDNGTIRTAQLSQDFFVVSQDGSAVQFFGGMEDFDFANSPEELLAQEFIGYREAIDQILGNGN